jgi:hypothetical protein
MKIFKVRAMEISPLMNFLSTPPLAVVFSPVSEEEPLAPKRVTLKGEFIAVQLPPFLRKPVFPRPLSFIIFLDLPPSNTAQ